MSTCTACPADGASADLIVICTSVALMYGCRSAVETKNVESTLLFKRFFKQVKSQVCFQHTGSA